MTISAELQSIVANSGSAIGSQWLLQQIAPYNRAELLFSSYEIPFIGKIVVGPYTGYVKRTAIYEIDVGIDQAIPSAKRVNQYYTFNFGDSTLLFFVDSRENLVCYRLYND